MCVKLVYDRLVEEEERSLRRGSNNVVYVHRQNRKYDARFLWKRRELDGLRQVGWLAALALLIWGQV